METELKQLRIDRSARTSRGSGSGSGQVVRWIVIVLAIVLLGAGALAGYRKLTAAVPVQIVQVQTPIDSSGAGQQVVLTATGYIIAAHKIEVASKVVGRVDWIGVEKGDHVKAGQIIVRLEDDEYRAQVLQSQGQLTNLRAKLLELQNGSRPEEIRKAQADTEQATADLENAKISLNRTKQLVAAGVLSKQSLDDAQAKYDGNAAKENSFKRTAELAQLGPRKEEVDQVRGQIDQARGSLQYAQTQLDNTLIKAPVTGTILDRNVEKGEFVINGNVSEKGAKGYVVTMADLNDLEVELDISQNDFPKVGPHQKGIVTTDAYPDRKYEGQIKEVSPEADRAKATIQVKVKILNPDNYLRPDMNATVSFYNEAKAADAPTETRRVVVIPEGTVQNGNVFVVLNGKARKHPVTTGGTTDKGIVIQSGLIGGEDLIMSPPADLKDGQRVESKK